MISETINNFINKINKIDNDLSEIFIVNIISLKKDIYIKDDNMIKQIINDLNNEYDKIL